MSTYRKSSTSFEEVVPVPFKHANNTNLSTKYAILSLLFWIQFRTFLSKLKQMQIFASKLDLIRGFLSITQIINELMNQCLMEIINHQFLGSINSYMWWLKEAVVSHYAKNYNFLKIFFLFYQKIINFYEKKITTFLNFIKFVLFLWQKITSNQLIENCNLSVKTSTNLNLLEVIKDFRHVSKKNFREFTSFAVIFLFTNNFDCFAPIAGGSCVRNEVDWSGDWQLDRRLLIIPTKTYCVCRCEQKCLYRMGEFDA